MTNEAIILNESEKLLKEGKIKGIQYGNSIIPEQLNTYQVWKQQGRQVKKGEKAIIQIPLWKHNTKQLEQDGEVREVSSMFMKTASLFTIEQTEAI